METLALKWKSLKKGYRQIFLADVYRIIPGVDSDFWRVSAKDRKMISGVINTAVHS